MKRGCKVAWQVHLRGLESFAFAFGSLEEVDREGFVVSSSWAMAAVRSAMLDVVVVVFVLFVFVDVDVDVDVDGVAEGEDD